MSLFTHQQVQLAVLPILKKYQRDGFTINDLIAEMNHAAWEFASLNDIGLRKLEAELKKKAQA